MYKSIYVDNYTRLKQNFDIYKQFKIIYKNMLIDFNRRVHEKI